MIKKVLTVLCLSFLIINLNACSLNHIVDNNGEDDFTVTQITDETIIKKSNYLSNRSVRTNNGNETNIRVKKLSGVMILNITKVKKQTLIYNIDSTVNSGNFRIVIVHDKEIIQDIKINTETTIEIPNARGTYILKIVGESANFSLGWSINKS